MVNKKIKKKKKKEDFWEFLENEVNSAEFVEEGLIIQMDGNLHAGPNLIKNDPNRQNQNGKLFMEFLERNKQLTVVNSLEVCEGVITRSRIVENKTEKAVLDFCVVNAKILPFIKKMLVDENKEFSLINLAQINKNKNFIESDHNALVMEMEINENQEKPKREEIFNFRNRVGQEAFKNETDTNEDLAQIKIWKQCFDGILKKCFKKIRIAPKKTVSKTEELLKERVKLKTEAKKVDIDENMKDLIKQRIEIIEKEITEDVVHGNFKMVVETLEEISDDGNINGSGRKKMWSKLRNKFPKMSQPIPIAKNDKKGNLVTNHQDLKNLYLKTYKQRMRNRPIKEALRELREGFKKKKKD